MAPLPEPVEIEDWVPQGMMIGTVADLTCVAGHRQLRIERLEKQLADLKVQPAAPVSLVTPQGGATPAPLADAELAELVALHKQATKAPWYAVGQPWGTGNWINTAEDPHAGRMIADFDTSITRDDSPDETDADVDNAHLTAAMRNALPGLLARLAAAEAKAAELPKVQEYVGSLLNDLLNHPELPASIHTKLWQHRQQLTVKGGQANA